MYLPGKKKKKDPWSFKGNQAPARRRNFAHQEWLQAVQYFLCDTKGEQHSWRLQGFSIDYMAND